MKSLRSLRQYSTTSTVAAPSLKPTNWRGYAAGAGAALVGLGFYSYLDQKPAPTALSTEEWLKFPLRSTESLTRDTFLFRFDLPTKKHELGLVVSSAILAKLPGGKDGKPIIRPYTPTSTKTTKGYFDLIIKVYPNGEFGQKLKTLKVGDTLEVKAQPTPKFTYVPNQYDSYSMIAGGSGVTPMLQVIREILANPNDKTKINLIFGNQTDQDIILRSELDGLKQQHPDQFKVEYIVDKASADWKGLTGFVSEDLLKRSFPGPEKKTRVLVCGPPGLVKFIAGSKAPDWSQGELDGLLKKMGYKADQVFKY